MKLNPKQMEKMAKQLGMKMEQIDAEQVIIRLQGGGEIIIDNPQVSRINVMGQDTFQITGDVTEKEEDDSDEEDVEIVVEKAGVSHDEARRVLDETNDIAEAILKLKEEHKHR
ncbi:MAG: nascent polypeptide-associated complex protein [Candidatus Aenigmarchaeota archaeon]|jgi:nascent polypeptide-associated complex subunit alpha|nr:nascent polypeptide-associated complex protein [Candidatus Aenigmarchaeota archaeon]